MKLLPLLTAAALPFLLSSCYTDGYGYVEAGSSYPGYYSSYPYYHGGHYGGYYRSYPRYYSRHYPSHHHHRYYGSHSRSYRDWEDRDRARNRTYSGGYRTAGINVHGWRPRVRTSQ
jgi:hypothetical protein